MAATYGYDAAGYLASVVTPAATVGYTTDARGLRQTRTAGSTTDGFLWSTVGGLPLLLDDGDHAYIYGPSSTPIAQIDDAGVVEYLHADLLGSVRLITDENGDAVATSSFDEFGNRVNHTGTADTAFGFTGAWTDPDTGLVHLRARDYDPATGQFLTVDLTVDQTRQPYAYTGNNPLTRTDPTGLDACLGYNDWACLSRESNGYIPSRTSAGWTKSAEGILIAAAAALLPGGLAILTSDDPAAQIIGGWALGVSEPETSFGQGSGLVESLRRMEETRNAQSTIVWRLQNGTYAGPINAGYAAGSFGLGNSNLGRDIITYLAWGYADESSRTKAALGTYSLSASVICIDEANRTAVIQYSGGNETTLGSAVGIGDVGRSSWNVFAETSGIGTKVSQSFQWTETIDY